METSSIEIFPQNRTRIQRNSHGHANKVNLSMLRSSFGFETEQESFIKNLIVLAISNKGETNISCVISYKRGLVET